MWFTGTKLVFLASMPILAIFAMVLMALPDCIVPVKEQKRREGVRQMQNRGDINAPAHVVPPQVVVPIGQYVLGVDHFTIDERFVCFSF